MLISARRILLPDAEEQSGYLEVVGERIMAAGAGPAPGVADLEIDYLVVPGFVDVHNHGGGGFSFDQGSDAARQALRMHREAGTTSIVASLVTAEPAQLCEQVAELSGLVRNGELAGIHFEGPWLSPERRGAHPLQLLQRPSQDQARAFLAAGGGAIRMVTLAPELPGAMGVIDLLNRHRVVAAVGHTNADYRTVAEAVAAGCRGATHLFNAMPGMQHRDPGAVLALWADQRVWLEIIFDNVHLQAELAAFVFATAGPRTVLVSDAVSAAGAGPGRHRIGGQEVSVDDGIVRIAGTDVLAGSTLTLDQAVRNAVEAGVSPTAAIRAATASPADYLGLTEVGRLAAGKLANLIVLDDQLQVTRVMYRGQWVAAK